MRLILSLAITAVTRFKTRPDPPVYFLLEEAAALGRLDVIEAAYGLMAGYGMQLHMIVQDLSQLSALYRERWQTFIGNSGVIQCFGTRDVMTAEYISRLCGVGTMESLSVESAERRAGWFSDPQYLSRHDSLTQRSLITPDEVMTLHPATQLLIPANAHPVSCFKTVYFLDERYRRKNGQPLFDIHPHYADRPLPRAVNFTRGGFDIGGTLDQIFQGG